LLAVDLFLTEQAAILGISAELRGSDAIYVALAKWRGIPLVTWDKDLLTNAVKAGVVAQVPTV